MTSRSLMLAMTVASMSCAVVKERGHDEVASLVEQRTGKKTRWEKGPPDDAQIAAWVRELTARGLTRDRAVEIALVNNPSLQATYEELGISQADMVQAGLLRNPGFSVEYGFPTSGGGVSELRLSLVQDFLDLFVLPLRKDIARTQFEADTLHVAHEALDKAVEAEKAFVVVQAASELVTFRRTVVDTAQAAADLSQRQYDAGNVSDLDRASEQAAFEQAKLELAESEIGLLQARESVNRLLGLWGETTAWKLAEALADIPAQEPALEHLESLAVRQRLDVAAARKRVELLANAVGLARSTRLFGRLEVGVDGHRDPDGPRVIGPNLVIDLPIFDQRQAFIARLEAQQRQQERTLSGLAIAARSEVRLAAADLDHRRRKVIHYRDVLLPLRKAVVDQALLHYNGMFVSLYQLLTVKQAEVDARRGYLEALRDYWSARAELARALGGGLPPPRAPAAAPDASSHTEGTDHHGH